jgi:hypothetical protein
MAHGGRRAGAGRRKLKTEVVSGNQGFATKVLERVGKDGWKDYADLAKVKSAEDLALHYIASGRGEEQFNRLIDRRYGKAVQTVNHVHDKPVEHVVTFRLAEAMRQGRERVLKLRENGTRSSGK